MPPQKNSACHTAQLFDVPFGLRLSKSTRQRSGMRSFSLESETRLSSALEKERLRLPAFQKKKTPLRASSETPFLVSFKQLGIWDVAEASEIQRGPCWNCSAGCDSTLADQIYSISECLKKCIKTRQFNFYAAPSPSFFRHLFSLVLTIDMFLLQPGRNIKHVTPLLPLIRTMTRKLGACRERCAFIGGKICWTASWSR